jgi:tetratricopeptide (TPR) repeat protein
MISGGSEIRSHESIGDFRTGLSCSGPYLPAILLLIITLAPYWAVSGFDFLVYDDYSYVTNNPVVREGLSVRGLSWAFTTFHASNWHPLTWLSHMLDVELFGVDAGWHHRVNVLFHLANTLLVFWVLRGMTGTTWRAFFVAALFGVHPLHVESVAWVAERKDVLSTFFWILTTAAYLRYVRRPGTGRYLVVLASFVLGLFSKPMVVTLPFVLLLLDWWPLGRMTGGEQAPALGSFLRDRLPRLALEKLPLLLLSTISCAVTYFAQTQGEAVEMAVSLWVRIQNALLAYATYLWKTLWPVSLVILYPHPGSSVPSGKAMAAGILLTLLTAASIRLAVRRPHLLVGWFWYLGTLIPVIGLVQVGVQSLADRYTYIPLLGIFIAVSWELNALRERLHPHRFLTAVVPALVLSVLVVISSIQVGSWRNSVTVFRHALEFTSNNWVAHINLGWALEQEGKLDEAMFHYRESIRIHPRNPYAHNNLGYVLHLQGRTNEAILHYMEALRLKPNYVSARKNLESIISRGKGP